ncbi:MAG TPA: FixH family protein, partial [Candidatus Binataceae bacterium]
SPPRRGMNKIEVTVRDASGRPVAGAEVSAVFYMAAMPAMGMAAMRAQSKASEHGAGIYEGELDLESAGTWQVTVVANKGGKQIASRQLSITATGAM